MPYQPYQPNWTGQYMAAMQQPMQYQQPAQYQQQPHDIVKDLSEAEKECWEAQYYMSVTHAMNSGSGYSTGAYAAQGYMPEPMGYDAVRLYDGRSGYRDSMGRYATRPSNMGYDGMRYGYDMQGLREAMSTASPEEREKMMREMRTMLGM